MQTLQMMPAEHSSHKNTTVQNFQQHSYHTLSPKPNGNGVLLNKKPMVYIMPLPNGTTTYKALTSLLEMTTNL